MDTVRKAETGGGRRATMRGSDPGAGMFMRKNISLKHMYGVCTVSVNVNVNTTFRKRRRTPTSAYTAVIHHIMLLFATLWSLGLLPWPHLLTNRCVRPRVSISMTTVEPSAGAQLVWYTGSADLRVVDHGGLAVACSFDGEGACVPVFVIDPTVHLQQPPYLIRRLHAALSSLEEELQGRYGCPLVIRSGPSATVLREIAAECGAAACHVVADDVCSRPRAMMAAGCAALEADGVEVVRWDGRLRTTPFGQAPTALPVSFPEYVTTVEALPLQAPLAGAPDDGELPVLLTPLASEGLAPLDRWLAMAEAAAPPAVVAARRAVGPTTPPYEPDVVGWCRESAVRAALDEYLAVGAATFADERLGDAMGGANDSLHAAAAQRLVGSGARPSAALGVREAACRAFAPALSLGALSAREARAAAAAASDAPLSPGDRPLWSRSDAGGLSDLVEWREWFECLAVKSLALQAAGEPATTGGAAAQAGDARAPGVVAFWRWGGAHLVRYERWAAGAAYDGAAPALLLVHGFAASAEQWERLVHALREAHGADALPPIYAIDLLGFGHSEKPGLSYTQYVWEAQLVDFSVEVMEGAPLVLVGNSIGGGLAAGAAATLGPLVRGVVLCNSAGVLESPEAYERPPVSVREATLRGAVTPYAPVPLLGPAALDLFGDLVIRAIFPQIATRLVDIYADRAANADGAVVLAIEQGAASPGSANVIGSGQKLAPNRPLNEVLDAAHGFGGPVLVCQGKNDRVSGPARAQERAQVFKRLRPGVTVRELDAGHCCHDEVPEQVAAALLAWLPEAAAWRPIS